MSEQTEYAGFEASEFAENPEPRVACVLLLDVSGSMDTVVADAGQDTGEIVQRDGGTYRVVIGGTTRIELLNAGLRTLKETLAAHRDKPECAMCHSRLDPVGLAFENFNALGVWRSQERSQTINPAGHLVTGEDFQGVRELKHIIVTKHRDEFYRTLATKFLTYATGRGLEYYDTETVDQIVQKMDEQDGRFSALLTGIIDSAPFQEERRQANPIISNNTDTTPASAVGARAKTQSAP
jgi:hypothetical protein